MMQLQKPSARHKYDEAHHSHEKLAGQPSQDPVGVPSDRLALIMMVQDRKRKSSPQHVRANVAALTQHEQIR